MHDPCWLVAVFRHLSTGLSYSDQILKADKICSHNQSERHIGTFLDNEGLLNKQHCISFSFTEMSKAGFFCKKMFIFETLDSKSKAVFNFLL